MTYAKKQFGQNFLKDKRALEKIVFAGDITPGDVVLEIGPGRGALTKKLLEAGATVIAVELDPEMILFLQNECQDQINSGQLKLIEEDILQVDIAGLGLQSGRYKIIANIPYYITGIIIRTFLESLTQPQLMVLLIQKEVAERIVDGQQSKGNSKKKKKDKENILSLSVKVYGDVSYIATVGRASFSPAPRVDSAIIKIENISHDKLATAGITEVEFFRVVKAGFAQKRKTLVNNLKHAEYEIEAIDSALTQIQVDEKVRAELLTLDQWIQLGKILK